MPHRPLSVCAEPGCAKLTRGRRCAEHQAELYRADRQQRGSTTDRGYGWRHQQLTAQTIAAHPWCSICGDTKVQVEARGDQLTGGHIIPRADGGRSVAGNYRTECGRCNYGHRGESSSRADNLNGRDDRDDRDDPPSLPPVFA